MKRKHLNLIGAVFFAVVCLTFYCTNADAAQKKVRFSTPALQCASGAARAIEAVSSVSGVVEAIDGDQTMTVIFDDDKAGVDEIKAALKKAGYPAEGEPTYLDK